MCVWMYLHERMSVCACVCVHLCLCVHMCLCTIPLMSRSEDNFGSLLFPSPMSLRMKLKLSDIFGECFYPPSHLASPPVTYFHTGIIKVVSPDRTASFKAPWPQIHGDLSLLKCIETVLSTSRSNSSSSQNWRTRITSRHSGDDTADWQVSGQRRHDSLSATLAGLSALVTVYWMTLWMGGLTQPTALDLNCLLSSHFSVVTESEGSALFP